MSTNQWKPPRQARALVKPLFWNGRRLSLGMLACLIAIALANPGACTRADEPAGRPLLTPTTTATIEFKSQGEHRHELGEVWLEGQDGGKLFLTADGQLWLIQPEEILQQAASTTPLQPLSNDQISQQLRSKLAPGFLIHKTEHFVLVYNTSETYVRWVGDLYERLYDAFHKYWDKNGIKLQEPRFPMVALVFDTREAYLQFARPEVKELAGAMIGYYNMQTNR
ncbi:MAG: hypothetical protein IT423_19675, partial [Pirellulaceae bacterium]|nr:hypothetical protein [Pirellulaceae bacterium]